ncbi:dimethyladenosine transferase 2, mitochondrial [Cynoglossus semilaevis]|uniref:dimethyladenosine transferase 2, mitochondrial n=1 Tax=Cynoglossus semilaevis TaxID=244447 RepID=UPI00049565FB|nr:dimethyladenosine transferase 2, mitochondrial [Cynoglossus semilaevis]
MSSHWCRSASLVIRFACGHSLTGRSCLNRVSCPAVCGRVVGAPVFNRRLYSSGRPTLGLEQSACTDKSPRSTVLPLRNLSAVAAQGHTHPLCQHEDLDVRDIEEKIRRTLGSRQQKHYLVDPQLATVVAQHLRTGDTDSVIFECNPGPGVLTRELINAGAQRVVALEGERSFLHDLRELEVQLGAQLEVLHCDYFKLDSVSYSRHNSPYMTSEELFSRLGISERAWTEGVPVKVVSILPQHKERNMLLKMVYVLLERMSVFRYGRIELNFFISEQEYLKMMSCPGDMINYRSSSVLWQMACDIRLLMKVPLESFVTTRKNRTVHKGKVPNDHMCLVRLCPRPHLFSEGLNSSNARALVMLIRQCLVKRRSKLIDKLNQWSHKSGRLLLSEMALPRDVLTGHVSPDQYLRLFLLMHHSQDFAELSLFEEPRDPSIQLCLT